MELFIPELKSSVYHYFCHLHQLLAHLYLPQFTFKVIRERVLLFAVVAGDRKIARLSLLLLPFALRSRLYEARIGGGLDRAAVVQSPRLRFK